MFAIDTVNSIGFGSDPSESDLSVHNLGTHLNIRVSAVRLAQSLQEYRLKIYTLSYLGFVYIDGPNTSM